MLIEGKRPRELNWYHAGPMLFGDWGTSRLYVLGLAFYYTRHASLWFMLAMSLLLIGVAWAYKIICRVYPDGGGVYSSARHRSPTLAVIGGLLLCADYIVTAAISSLDGFHYLNVARPELYALGALVLIGGLNYFGPKKSGTLALVVALATVVLTLVIGLYTVPSLGHAQIDRPAGNPLNWWAQFTALILAISGVEAVANMTGLMVEPVEKTAARSIWPVLIEIVVLNLVLTVAMLAIPTSVLGGGNPENAYTLHRDDMLRAIAEFYVGPGFAMASAVVFAMLLLSAANTAITDLVSIQFMMSRDRELPAPWGLLNGWGMPVYPLLVATAIPVVVLIAVADVEKLADLYAIGVVGAVSINLGCCATNPKVELTRVERYGMGGLAVLMIAVWITIAYEKPHALLFAMGVLVAGLATRYLVQNRARVRQWVLREAAFPWKTVPIEAFAEGSAAAGAPPHPVAAGESGAPGAMPLGGRVLLATRGRLSLFHFGLAEARSRNAELYVLFVRHLAVAALGAQPSVESDPAAQKFFATAIAEAAAAGVPIRCLYVVARHVAETILDFAVTYSPDVLILAAPTHGPVWRAVKGNVLRKVARHLPSRINLLVHH